MPDWKKIVREKLGTLPLTHGRREEVIEELAEQLESAYEEALAQGINEQEALQRSIAQFKDWEKLRREVFQSVEGTHLPVWEQNGAFAPRRWPVWIALALALSLLLVPAFRQALAILLVPGNDTTAWCSRIFPEKVLRRIEQSGDKEKYARALAFVALHSPKEDDERAMHAAEKAIALDPNLTWISAKVSHPTYLYPDYDPHPWIERLKAWDPQNGFPYLLEADANVHYWEPPWTKYAASAAILRQSLAAERRWRIPMEKVFAAPRMDFYQLHRDAYTRLLPLLRRGARADEAAAVESALAVLPRFDYSVGGPAHSSLKAAAKRSAQVILISAVFVAVLGLLTALWLVLVIVLRWKRNANSLSHLLNRLASPLCFAPPALLLVSVALFLGYYPYARSIAQINSYQELEYGYVPVLMGLDDLTSFVPLTDFWVAHMFWPSLWCAAVALAGACLLWWVRRLTRPDRPDAA